MIFITLITRKVSTTILTIYKKLLLTFRDLYSGTITTTTHITLKRTLMLIPIFISFLTPMTKIRFTEEKRCQKEILDLFFVDVQVDEMKKTVGMKRHADTNSKAVHQSPDPKQLLPTEKLIGGDIEESMTSGPPILSPVVTKRSIFTSREKLHSSLASSPKPLDERRANAGSTRSIFTNKEKNQGRCG